MSIEISAGAQPAAASPPLAGQRAAAAASTKAAEPASPKVINIPRPQIKVDTEQKQQEVQAAVSNLNERMRDGGRGLNFAVDKAVGGPVVTVTNQDTGEIIRQIPNATAVKMAHSLDELKGHLLNAKT